MPDDGVRVDYFDVLDLPRDASRERIAAAIKQQMRTWQKRTTNPDLSKRQEAEQRVQLLGEAREVLLDDARRTSYLDQLAATAQSDGAAARHPRAHAPGDQRSPQQSPPPHRPTEKPRPHSDWVQQAEDYLSAGDFNSAAYAAREARQEDGQSAEAWSVLSRANAGLGNLRDAAFEARQAVKLDPDRPGHCMNLGVVHEQLHEWEEALSCYRQAQTLAPDTTAAQMAIANVLMQTGRAPQARPILEELRHATTDDSEQAAKMLAMCMVMEAEQIPVVRHDGRYVVTSKREIDAMRGLLDSADQVTDDAETLADVHHAQRYLRWCERRHFHPSGTTSAGCLLLLAIVVVAPALVLGGLSLYAGPSTTSLLVVAASVAFIVLCFFAWFRPGWKLNKRARRPGAPPPVSTR